MVPPAALCVHLRIGRAYAFSVFNLPMITTPLHLFLARGFVGISLAWGVIQTLLNALKLFQ